MSGRAGPDSHFDWAECVGGKGLAQCLWLIEHRWRSEVAGQQKDHLVAALWRTNRLTLRHFFSMLGVVLELVD